MIEVFESFDGDSFELDTLPLWLKLFGIFENGSYLYCLFGINLVLSDLISEFKILFIIFSVISSIKFSLLSNK